MPFRQSLGGGETARCGRAGTEYCAQPRARAISESGKAGWVESRMNEGWARGERGYLTREPARFARISSCGVASLNDRCNTYHGLGDSYARGSDPLHGFWGPKPKFVEIVVFRSNELSGADRDQKTGTRTHTRQQVLDARKHREGLLGVCVRHI